MNAPVIIVDVCTNAFIEMRIKIAIHCCEQMSACIICMHV